MNLKKLFEMQKVLRDRIGYNEPDRFNKLILALLVELGECANEQRTWKFWSKDQTPRVNKARKPYMDLEDAEFYNPLLEEYVDGLHFVLELGLEEGYEDIDFEKEMKGALEMGVTYKSQTITEQFLNVFYFVTQFENFEDGDTYIPLALAYIQLGEMLGFTWQQIEQAYFEKNQINHQRQQSGVY